MRKKRRLRPKKIVGKKGKVSAENFKRQLSSYEKEVVSTSQWED